MKRCIKLVPFLVLRTDVWCSVESVRTDMSSLSLGDFIRQ